MPMFLQDPLQTMAAAFEEIKGGEEPWVALGNFLNDWCVYARDRRAELVADPLVWTESIMLEDSEERRWATFIAASVEYLCQQNAISCPVWVHDPRYQLSTPWYDAIIVDNEVRTWLEETTPESFKRRNIYCGDRVFFDKQAILDFPSL